MDILDTITGVYRSYTSVRVFIVPLLMSLFLYFVFRKREELGWNAIQNTAATFFVALFNFGVVLWFFRDITTVIKRLYDALHIPTLPDGFWDTTPLWVVVILGIASKDFVDYWNHRFMHTRWAWPTHAAHHSDTHVNAFTTYRVHFLESLVMASSYLFLLTWLQMPEAIPFVLVLSNLHNMYLHMDLPWTHGRLRYLVASPVFHRWHHADVPEAYGKNLSNHIPLWDVLFGTYYAPDTCDAPMGALKSGIEDKNPVKIYLYPLFEWTRLIRATLPSRTEPTPERQKTA